MLTNYNIMSIYVSIEFSSGIFSKKKIVEYFNTTYTMRIWIRFCKLINKQFKELSRSKSQLWTNILI